MKPLYVSFWTPDYEARARVLMKSLKKHGCEFEVTPVDEQGSWQKNTHLKPAFIWKKMTEHFDTVLGTGRPVVWVDADAEVLAEPVAFEHVEADLMVIEFKHPELARTELLSGTIYFRNNMRSHRVVDAWIEECAAHPDVWDQKCLRKAIDRFVDDGLRITYLPVSYCYIFDRHKQCFPEVDPIILHHQESRAARTRKPTV